MNVWEKTFLLERFTCDELEATKKLKEFYASSGFKSIGKTEFMVMSLM